MLRDVGGLRRNKNLSSEEVVAIFLFILSHNTKNRRTRLYLRRSGETVLDIFPALRCQHLQLKKSQPVPHDCQE